ncbi:unnamed protein product [Ambrosiozyma monospora]|uniref:Unnamed protein product n=1 Tax=Ambrosiozyma monospora TaxID=43982 RepID=A0A9W6Z5Q6_AMBMO|nr:unnamed protein product [Ambrosiozyma monospora]
MSISLQVLPRFANKQLVSNLFVKSITKTNFSTFTSTSSSVQKSLIFPFISKKNLHSQHNNNNINNQLPIQNQAQNGVVGNKLTTLPQIRALSKTSTSKVSAINTLPPHPVFTPEEVEAARLARLNGLGLVGKFPKWMIPYMELMRIEKPIGTLLLLSPCMWGITMAAYISAAPFLSTLWMASVFAVGAFVMRGAGCTINDLLDRNLDNQVARTCERPITSGRVSVKQAIWFLGAQLAVGCGVLLCLPLDCFLLGASSLILVGTYPLFKRFTYYPQIALSACFNWGALLGFPAMGVWAWPVMIPLYLSGFFWCMHYDTIYAHQDKKFDVKAGIGSTALAWDCLR